MKPRLSAVIITRDEEDTLRDCLESLRFADEVVVLDSGSTDRTVEIAHRYTDLVFGEEWRGYAAQKNAALERCTGDWVLSLDADERVTEGLHREIEAVLSRPASDLPDGFSMPRLSFHLGRWIRRGGWYPDRKVRLARRDRCSWTGEELHERLEVRGRLEELANPLLHYTYRDLSDHLAKVDRYTTIMARARYARGERSGLGGLVLHPLGKFLRMYLFKGGVLEGKAGFVLAAVGAWYVFLKYAKLWELSVAGSGQRASIEKERERAVPAPPVQRASIEKERERAVPAPPVGKT